MSGYTFEDLFDHDPNDKYEEEEEEDLGRDDEFAGQPLPDYAEKGLKRKIASKLKTKNPSKINRKRQSSAQDGDDVPHGGVMKYVFFGLCVAATYLFFYAPQETKEFAIQAVDDFTGQEQEVSRSVVSAVSKTPVVDTAAPEWLKAWQQAQTAVPEKKTEEKSREYKTGATRKLTEEYKNNGKVLDPKAHPLKSMSKDISYLVTTKVISSKLPNSKARGALPALHKAARANEKLEQRLNDISHMNLNEADVFRSFAVNLIYLWAGVTDLPDEPEGYSQRKAAVVEISRSTPLKMRREADGVEVIDPNFPLPPPPPPISDEETMAEWDKLSNEIVYDLFLQSILKNAGIKYVYNETSGTAVFNPLQVMADLLKPLTEVLAQKKTEAEKMKLIEPVSSFLLNACGKDMECLGSYDLFMETLGFSEKETSILQKNPQSVYRS